MTDSPNADAHIPYRRPAEVYFRDENETMISYDNVQRDGAWLICIDDGLNGGLPTYYPISRVRKVDRLPQTGTVSAGAQDASADSRPSGSVADIPADDEAEAYVDAMSEWFASAAGVNGFDPSIVDLSWGEAGGTEGVIVELSPFGAGYWSDGEWQDKEGFESEKETAKETVLKPRDEFEWHGEPDYLNFISESDIDEVVG